MTSQLLPDGNLQLILGESDELQSEHLACWYLKNKYIIISINQLIKAPVSNNEWYPFQMPL